MLNFLSSRRFHDCDGATRRDFLKVGALGATGLTLPALLQARAQAAAQNRPTRNTSIVWLWLGGGPTHVETFDPKMTAPAEFRSTVGAVQTSVTGVQIGGVFPKVARVADKAAFVRSFAHTNSGHGGGTHWVMTGYNFAQADNGGGQSHPALGSILCRYRGASNQQTGLPTYVRMNGIRGDGPAWLGSAYAPFDVAGNARQNMNVRVSMDRLNDRQGLLDTFDTIDRNVDRSGLMAGLDSFETQAFELLKGDARNAFDVSREDPRTRDTYGSDRLAQQMLLARRLCESGVGFVTIQYGGWDMHGRVERGMKQRGPIVDHAVATFVEDVAQRGLENDILLVVTGEFGRTPRINRNAGRDHWAPLSTLALFGGGLRMGQTIGESTARAERPARDRVSPQDLMATVFHVLGIPQDIQYHDQTGRPKSMISGGRVVPGLM